MELYINNGWTERYGNAHIAQAIAWSENGNHATIYTVGPTAQEANAKLVGALGELKLIPDTNRLMNSGLFRSLGEEGHPPLSSSL